MSDIKRYHPMIDRTGRYTAAKMRQIAGGSYVNYQDHTATLQQARIDAVREFVDSICNKEISQWSQRLREESGWYIEQLKEQGE